METIFSLVDKLAIITVKLYHAEDRRRDKNLSDGERLKAADEVTILNQQRNNLVEEGNLLINKSIKEGNAPIIFNMKQY